MGERSVSRAVALVSALRANSVTRILTGWQEPSTLPGKPPFRLSTKPLYHVRGLLTTAGSPLLGGHRSRFTAETVAALSGRYATVVRDNLDTFGVGRGDNAGIHGPYRSGEDLGGSSWGGAYNVAVGLADLALGTDTGGSVRDVTAPYPGLWGFKPTNFTVSRHGMVPHSNTLDSVGFIAGDLGHVFRGWVSSLKARRHDSSLLAPCALRRRMAKRQAEIVPGGVIIAGRLHRSRLMDPSRVVATYMYFSSVYFYSNMLRYSNKRFTSESTDDWLYKPGGPGVAGESTAILERFSLGRSLLAELGGSGTPHHTNRKLLSRWLEVMGQDFVLSSNVREPRLGEKLVN